jgi:hypothetical protein
MKLPGKKSLCKAFAVAACAVGMTGCAIVPMDPYYPPVPVVVAPAPVIVPGPVIYGPVRPYYPPHHHHHYPRGHRH